MAAFSGVHVSFSFAGADKDSIPILRSPVASKTFTSAGITDAGAQSVDPVFGEPVVTIAAVGSPWWVSFGVNPGDPALANTVREHIEADSKYTYALQPGQFVRVAPDA